MDRKEILRRFDYVSSDDLTSEQVENCIAIRTKFKNCAMAVRQRCGLNPREEALAVTKLEEALAFAIGAIVRPSAVEVIPAIQKPNKKE